MPPIPIYTQSPINAAKASGVTPQTAAQANNAPNARQPAAATTPSKTQQGYPAARPGAAPSLPAPTGTAQVGQYVSKQPTPTTKAEIRGPAPPQPGAVPIPRGSQSGVPPPPRATGNPSLPGNPLGSYASTLPTPPQMSIPTPTMPFSQRGTSTDYPSGPSYSARGFEKAGVQPHLGNPSGPSYSAGGFEQSEAQSHRANSLANPPGYQQHVSASEVDGDQRAGYDSLGFSGRGNTGPDEDEEGVWDSAKKWAQTAGGKLSAAENEVWRRINKG